MSTNPDHYRWGRGERDPWNPPVPGGPGEARMARGSRLAGESWSFLRARPRLLWLPALSAVTVTLAAVAIGLPTLAVAVDAGASYKVALFAVAAACAFPLTVLTTYFNVAFLTMVIDDQSGREPSVRRGLAAARSRLGPIVAWSAMASAVGLVLQALQQLPHVGGWAGRLLSFAGGIAWSLATFFVVPVLALRGTGARESVRRSAGAFKERWGEAVTGDVTIGVAFVFAAAPGWIVAVAGATAAVDGALVTGLAVTAVGVTLLAPVLVYQSAVIQLFQLSLYQHVSGAPSAGPFATADLEAAVKPKSKRRWWRRSG